MTLVKLANGQRPAVFKGYTDVLDSLFNTEPSFSKSATLPAANIVEADSYFKIELAVPGYKKENFKINLDQNILQLSAVENGAQPENSENLKIRRREFKTSSFKRAFTMPDSADLNSIDAQYIDGILSIVITKKEEAKIQSREIEVK